MYRKLKQYYYLEYDTKQFGMHKLSIKFCNQNDSTIVNTMFSNIPDIGAIAVLDVFFDSDKSIVKNESDNAMLNVATLMNVYPGMEIEVRGHTDASNGTKDPNYNQKLSEKRAQAVKDYLQSKYNISSNRIQSKGYGDTMPIDDNATEEGRARNRRTEIRIVKQ
jgi:outer membrane protein OmpA-like peptidoglycan-associated protein